MADPEAALAATFRRALVAAFGAEFEATDPAIRPSQHADYQANVALGLKARLGKPPRDIAKTLVDHIDGHDLVEKLDIAGPGFVNVTLKSEALTRGVRAIAADSRLGLPLAEKHEIIVVDYSSPNVAKEMHVGHLRSSIIGDALVRLFEARGHHVIRQNHLGDWGTPFGMLIEHLLDLGEGEEEQSMAELTGFYQAARAKFDGDPDFADRARRRVVGLQAGDPATLDLWERIVEATVKSAQAIYEKLGVSLAPQDVAGESFYNPMLSEIVKELTEKKLCVESDGALCVFPPGFKGKSGAPLPLIVQKQDGGYGYATTDLAAMRYRLGTLGASRVLIVVGAPQAQHLAMVFETAKLAGWLAPPAHAEHVAFGQVLGPDGKMFKTRGGATVKLNDLLDEAIERARAEIEKKNPELPVATRESVARMVGIGAVKHGDLSSDRVKDYVFDVERMVAFEGNTAPYVQYAHARCRSIFRKSGAVSAEYGAMQIEAPAERSLALALLKFPTAAARVEATLEPHHLCTYLFELANTFSTFYEACPVLKASTDAERASRLALTELTAHVLAMGLDILGIEAPEEM